MLNSRPGRINIELASRQHEGDSGESMMALKPRHMDRAAHQPQPTARVTAER